MYTANEPTSQPTNQIKNQLTLTNSQASGGNHKFAEQSAGLRRRRRIEDRG
jgi:hypothetical protein